MNEGLVKWFSAEKGYGFITPSDGGKDLFVHHSEIKSDADYKTLNENQSVEYKVRQNEKGPCAVEVIVKS